MIQSLTFWIVLAVSVPIFWLLPKRLRYAFLAAASFGYMLTLEPVGVCTLVAWTLLFAYLAPRAQGYGRKQNLIAATLVTGILAYLAAFKYIPIIIKGLMGDTFTATVAIPLGVSYFSFKLAHYAIEVHRGNIKSHSLHDLFCYILLFPIFTAGPIERFDHFLLNREDRWDPQTAVEGLTRIIHGLIKKLFVAECLIIPLYKGMTVQMLVQNLDALPVWKVWGYMILSLLYLYMDFGAYSDIAIGASRLFGIRIMENFNWPIFARNLGEFWQRWHMTLVAWCRGYVYMPMIGLTRNPYLASYCTFGIMGLWHAGSLHWLCWSLHHATGISVLVMWLQIKRRRRWATIDKWPWRWAGVPVTLLFVAAGSPFAAGHGLISIYDSFRLYLKLVAVDLAA